MATYAECEADKKYKQLVCMADVGHSPKRSETFGFTLTVRTCQPDRVRVATTIHSPGPKQPFTLVYPASEGEVEREEVILHVQGYVVDSELPPIVRWSQ